MHEHLVGRRFVWGKQDCYALVRDYYRDAFGIELLDFPRPNINVPEIMAFSERYEEVGFTAVDIPLTKMRVGDGVLMAINSSYGNHVGVHVGEGKVLHHLVRRLSEVTSIHGLVTEVSLGIFRHKDVEVADPQPTVTNFSELLPPHIRERLRDAGAIG